MGAETSPKPFICIHPFSFVCRKLNSGVNTRRGWSCIIPISSALAILIPGVALISADGQELVRRQESSPGQRLPVQGEELWADHASSHLYLLSSFQQRENSTSVLLKAKVPMRGRWQYSLLYSTIEGFVSDKMFSHQKHKEL